jgi:tetratricopeptide (TPR) repeat protein
MNSPGRNDPCACGSGRKYKKCCLAAKEAQRLPNRVQEKDWIAEIRHELDEAVDGLMQRLERGEGKRVEADIAKLLEENPNYHMTHYAMGVYQVTVSGDSAEAIRYFERAVAIFPPFAEAHFNLGMAARQLLDIFKAVQAFRAAERYAQYDGTAAMARKELEQMESVVLKTTPFRSLDAYVANAQLFDRAFACLGRQEYEKAVELFQSCLSQHPRHVQSHGNLALAYAGLGRRADALASFDRALELDPDYAPAIENRRVVLAMREGEPLIPDGIEEVEFYADQIRSESGTTPPSGR